MSYRKSSLSSDEGEKETFEDQIKKERGLVDSEEDDEDNRMDQSENFPEAEDSSRWLDMPSTSRADMSNQPLENVERSGEIPKQTSTLQHGSDYQRYLRSIARKKGCSGPSCNKRGCFPHFDPTQALASVNKPFEIPPQIERSPNPETEIVDKEKFIESIKAEIPEKTRLKSISEKGNKGISALICCQCSKLLELCCCIGKGHDSEDEDKRVDDRSVSLQTSSSFIAPNPESNTEPPDQIQHSFGETPLSGRKLRDKKKSSRSLTHPYKKTKTVHKQKVDTKPGGTQNLPQSSQLAEEQKSQTSSSGSQQSLSERSKSVGQERQDQNLSSPEQEPKYKEHTTATTPCQTLNPPQRQISTEHGSPGKFFSNEMAFPSVKIKRSVSKKFPKSISKK